MRKLFSLLLASALAAGTLIGCADNSAETASGSDMDTSANAAADPMANESMNNEPGVMVGGANMVPSKNIVENAAASSEHTTLVSAVQAAGLAETLSGAGPFTVFAPTNAAFDKLPQGTVESLLQPENKEKLTNVLTYHVVPGSLRAADLTDGMKLKTVQGQELTVMLRDGKVMIDGATVTIPDVISSNGVTHVIDAVVMPK